MYQDQLSTVPPGRRYNNLNLPEHIPGEERGKESVRLVGYINFVPQLVVGRLIVSLKRKARREKGKVCVGAGRACNICPEHFYLFNYEN